MSLPTLIATESATETGSRASPETVSGAAAEPATGAPPPQARPLTPRQEAFCRHYAASGNAAGAARAAGYAEGAARQTGHDLLERPGIAERVRDIRQAWRTVAREEAQILLDRLEQAWDIAVEKGSAALMLRVVKLQADLSGLDRRNAHRCASLWPLPEETSEELPGEMSAEQASGPLAGAVRRGRSRTERAFALHRANRKFLERRGDFDEADWLAAAQRLHAAVEERRLPTRLPADRPAPGTGADTGTDTAPDTGSDTGPDRPVPKEHDISLQESLHGPGRAGPANGSADRPVLTEHDRT